MYPGILKSPTAEESLFGKATLRGIPVLIGKAHLKFIRDRPMIGTVCVEHGGPPVLVRATRVGLAGTDLVTPIRPCWPRRHRLGHADPPVLVTQAPIWSRRHRLCWPGRTGGGARRALVRLEWRCETRTMDSARGLGVLDRQQPVVPAQPAPHGDQHRSR